MQIIDLDPNDDDKIHQVAAMLVDGFADHWPDAWPDMDSALKEVRESFGEDRISRIALVEGRIVAGWIAALPLYDAHVWELHPLVVLPGMQGQGIGTALVRDLERLASQAGADTIFLGTDDQNSMTSLAFVDLYPDIPGAIRGITNHKGHPYSFYQKLGFVIVGVIPDANGPGKPDILMAKRVT